MSTCLHVTEFGSPRSDALPLPVPDESAGAPGIPAGFDVQISTPSLTAVGPSSAADVIPVLALTDALIPSDIAIPSRAPSPPDGPSANDRPMLVSPVPAQASSANVPPSLITDPAVDGIHSVSPDGDSPVNTSNTSTEHIGHPASNALPHISPSSLSDARLTSARQMSSVGVQTLVIITKRGEYAMNCPLLRTLRSCLRVVS